MITVNNLTMTYPSGKGIFDVCFAVTGGTAVGFLGPNGAGKTTTVRCLLGFMKGSSGSAEIAGLDCFKSAPQNMKNIGFIAGEPAFPEGLTGLEYLNFLLDMRGIKDKKYMNELISLFELDVNTKIKRMSKGMKQKTAIVAAFMHNPDILILDEPTSGLDPLMQQKFVELVLREKRAGKTILISSHIFEEVEKLCDEVIIIKDGKIVAGDSVINLKHAERRTFIVKSKQAAAISESLQKTTSMGKHNIEVKPVSESELEVTFHAEQTNKFIRAIAKFDITCLNVKEMSLEDIFMSYYGKKEGGEMPAAKSLGG